MYLVATFASHSELSEFVLQLDEEVEGMQSTVLSLEHSLKELRDSLTGSSGGGPSKTGKEKSSRSTFDGPLETHKDSGSKIGARSQDS